MIRGTESRAVGYFFQSLRPSTRAAWLALAILLVPAGTRGQTLIWDPNSSGSLTGSDNGGAWDTASTTTDWFNGISLPDVGWTNGDNAVIGAGTMLTTSPAIMLDSPNGVIVGNITFNALGAGSSTGYTIADSSGTGANTLGIGGSNAMTITNNAAGATTTINANIVSNAANPFSLNILGSGNLAFGGSIGVTSGANNAAGTLQVGTAGQPSSYTGTLTLGAANNLSGVTINSGTVSVAGVPTTTIPSPFGTGPVTLSGGTLAIGAPTGPAIAMNVATSQTGSATVAFVYNTLTSSSSAAGVVPVAAANWNNLLISRGTTPEKGYAGNSANTSSNHQSTLPFTLGDSTGAATTAQVVNWWGSNTFSTTAANQNYASGNQQMLSSGFNANGSTSSFPNNQSSFTLAGIPYSSYNVYLYYWNNGANSLGQAVLETGTSITAEPSASANPTGIGIAKMVAPTFVNANTSYPTYFYNTGGATAPTALTQSTLTSIATTSTPNTDYVEWTNVSGSSMFVGVQEDSGGTPWIAGIEIVPTFAQVSNPLSVTSNSTLSLSVLTSMSGGTSITSSGTPTVLSVALASGVTSATLDLSPAVTTFSGTGGTLNPASGVTINLGAIADGGSGFSTAGAGTIVLKADSTSTLSGPVAIGGITQLAMSSTTSGSATGTGPITVGSGGILTGNGIVTPGASNLVTVASGGTIRAPAGGSTLRVNGPTTVNGGGALQSGAGTFTITGATTINSGGSVAVGNGQLITASGGLTLAGAASTFTITKTATTTPFINVTGGGASSLAVSGSNTISILLSGNPNTTVGSTTTYDLINYAGTDLAPTASGAMLTFSGGTLSASTPGTGGLPAADQLTLVDIAGTGGSPNQIELMVTVPGPITWTGAAGSGGAGAWDTISTNWATATPAATQYVDGSAVTFADKNPITNANVTNSNITITPAQVAPASIAFTNSAVNYAFNGGSIGGASGGVTLSGTGAVSLNNSNTFVGAVAVNAGQLILGNATALGNSSGVTVASGAALALNNTSGNPMTFSTPAAGTGTIPLSLGGAGLTAGPAGALDSIAGNNTYSGAITLTAATTINSASAATGDGLTLGGAISTTAGNFGLSFTGPGNTTASGIISGGGGLTMAGTGMLTLSGANTFTGAVQINSGGTLRAQNNKALGTAPTATVATGAALALQGGISIGTIPLTLSGAGVASNPTGALNSISGANAYAGAITLAGNTTIGSSSATAGDGLTLSGAINTTASNYGLTFTGAGNTTASGVIGGGGGVTMSGAGTLALSKANTYSGGTVIQSGMVAISNSNSALGTGGVTLSGGTLRFGLLGGAGAIGLNIAADGGTAGSSAGEQPETIGSTAVAGVVPINNWNDFVVTRFLNGGDNSNLNPPAPQSVPTTSTPFTLKDSTGASTTAQVTAWQSNNTFSVYGASEAATNANAQLVNGFIGALKSTGSGAPTFPAKVTVSTVPLSGYNVYVYFNNNNAGQNALISLTSGSYTSPTYYVSTQGAAPLNGTAYTFTSGTASTSGTFTASNYVAIPVPQVGASGGGDSFTVTLDSATAGGNTPGIAAIEIVSSAGPAIGNSIAVTADSSIDVTGSTNASAGNLTIGGQTLNVTGGSTGAGAAYTMTLGAATLTGNATFNVANNSNGSGAGTLRLGAVGDGGSGFGVTINNGNSQPGTVVLTAGGAYTGATDVNGGTLLVNGALSGSGPVTVANGGTLSGPIVNGSAGSMTGAVTVQSGGAVAATNGATFGLAGGLALAGGSASTFNLSGSPNGTSNSAAAMIVTSGGSGATSLMIGAVAGDIHTINLTGNLSPTPGTYSYDLASYSGTALTSSGPSSGSALAFTNAPGSLALGTGPFGPFAFQLVNNPASKQIDLQVTAYPLSWTGAQGSSWDTTGQVTNFAAVAPTPFNAAYVDGASVTFGDTNIVQHSSLALQFVTIQSGGVKPASVTFTNTGNANNGADYNISNATNSLTNQPDTAGIGGSTGLTLAGNGSAVGGQVVLGGANSFTGPVQVSAGDLQLGVAGALGNSSGVTIAAGAELDLNDSSATTVTYGTLAVGGGTIPLTLAGAGLTGNPAGTLNNIFGKNTYSGPITLSGAATIASSSTSSGDGLFLSGGINTTASGFALSLVGVGNTTISGAISGAGSVAYNGSGTLTLSTANSYSGGTTISATGSGLVAVTNSGALGSGGVTLASGTLQFAAGPTVTISNAFSVTGPATIDLTGSGAVTVGTLQIGATTLSVTGGSTGAGAPYSLSTAAVTLAGNAEFDVSNNSNGSGAGTLQLGAAGDGGHSFGVAIGSNAVSSPGTVVLTAGGTYGGPTNINAGALRVNGPLTGTGAVTVANGATLSGPIASGGAASIAGNATVQSGGTIAAANGAAFSLAGGLTLAAGSNSALNLTGAPNGTSDPTAALIATSGAGPTSLVVGAASGDTHTINLTGSPFAHPGTWTYDLFSYTGTPLSATSSNNGATLTFSSGTVMNLGSPLPSGPYSGSQLVNNPSASGGQIDLQVTAYPITWTGGANNNAWDTTTVNWAFAPPSGTTSTNYAEGAAVAFADTTLFGGTVFNSNGLATVNIQASGVSPSAVTFTNTGAAIGGVDYFLNGGGIGGAATAVTKTGAGTVTINTANTYGGGTLISAGTVVAAQPSSLGTGPVTLSGGALRLGSYLAGFGGTSTSVAGTSTWSVNNTVISSNPISSDVLTLTDNTGSEARSAFYNTPVPVVGTSSGFKAQFTYTPSGAKAADGVAFILQNSTNGASALGAVGGALGYGGAAGVAIAPSVAFEMNLFSSNTVGVAWRSNGATGSPYSAVTPVSLGSGDPIQVQLSYSQANTTLTAVLTDTVTNATFTYTSAAVNVANALGEGTAYVGFSGGDGAATSTQQVGGFSYAPTGAYANSVLLSPSTTSTIDLVASPVNSACTIGPLTVGSGGAATLNVTASTATAGQSYSLTTGSVMLNSNATFNVANNGSATGTLSLGAVADDGGSRAITIGGPGTVVLTAGGSYGGPTTINGGVLRVIGALSGTGAVSVNGGAMLSGPIVGGNSGSVAGAVTVASGGSIAAANGAAFSLTGGLTLSAGSASSFTLSAPPNGAGSGVGLIATSGGAGGGSLVIGGAHTVNLTGIIPVTPGAYTYDLFSYTGTPLTSSGSSSGSTLAFTNSAGTLTLGSLPASNLASYQLVNNPNVGSGGQIDLAVTAYALAWTGANGAAWDTATQNWAVASPSPVATSFVNGASVLFGDTSPLNNQTVPNTAGLATVTVQSGGVQPGSITFTNSGTPTGVNYTIGGGPIGGSTGITVNGAGSVALTGANTFTGPVQLNAGTLTIASDTLIAGGAAPLGVAPAAAANSIFINGGTLQARAGGSVGVFTLNANRGIALGPTGSGSGTGTIDVTAGTGLTYGGAIANAGTGSGALVKSDSGTLVLAGGSNYSGGTTVSGGTLAIGLSSNPAGNGPITLAGGNLQLYGQSTGTPQPGLTAAFYAGSSSLSTGGTSDPNLASLSTLVSHFATQTPAHVALSTTGGMASLNWASASGGNLFAAQGFTGTANFEAILAGGLVIAQSGAYTFQTGSDDGSVLYIDGSSAPEVNNNSNHGYTLVTSGTIQLSAGVHQMVVGYYQGGGGAQLSVSYNGPDTGNTLTPIPNAALGTNSTAAYPLTTQTYGNNISLTSSATINVSGSLAATVGNLNLTGSTLALASSDLSTAPYSLTVGSLIASGTSGVSVAASSSGGAGTLQITAPPTFASGAVLNIAAGRVQFNVNSGTATVGTSVSANVSSGATLELAGAVAALASGANRVSIVNSSSTAGIVVSGTNQVVGGIDGSGTTQVNAGSDLTADHIVQSALIIGGTSSSPALVTIDASDANGNPLGESFASAGSKGSLVIADSLEPKGSFAAGIGDSSNVSSAAGAGTTAAGSLAAPSGTLAGAASAAVPEPSSLGLALVALIGCAAAMAARSRKGARWLRSDLG